MSFSRLQKAITLWNQKLHIYIGLYVLVFVWLFACSGLILNHPKWQFPQFWDSRKETTAEYPVRMPSAATDLANVQDLMGQLQLSGEIERIERKPESFEFRVAKPHEITTVTITPASERAKVQQIRWNGWGVLNALHHLTGIHGDNAALTRNRLATWAWSVWMDVGSVGLLVLVVGGLYAWYQRKEARVAGLVVLVLGVACCGVFLFAV